MHSKYVMPILVDAIDIDCVNPDGVREYYNIDTETIIPNMIIDSDLGKNSRGMETDTIVSNILIES